MRVNLKKNKIYWYKFELCDLKKGCAPKISMRVNFKKVTIFFFRFAYFPDLQHTNSRSAKVIEVQYEGYCRT